MEDAQIAALRKVSDELTRLRVDEGDINWGSDLSVFICKMMDERQAHLDELARFRKKRADDRAEALRNRKPPRVPAFVLKD